MAQDTYLMRRDGEAQFRLPVVAKTANYTIKPTEGGTIFTNRGDADALTLTLPAATAVKAGWHIYVLGIADQNIAVAAATADTLITFNDATADSVAFSTTGEKIGAHAMVVFDGTSFVFVNLSPHTATVTT